MMTKCSVSVLVPVCNVERYLRQCLESLVAQTLNDIQIICLDDGSTDSSPDILEEFRRIDPRIEVVTKPNSGYGDSMNIGLGMARGEYIGIVESDDFAEPDMFEQLYAFAKRHDADAVKSNFFAHTEDRDPKDDELVVNFGEGPFDTVFCPLEHQDVFIWRAAIWSGLYRTEFLRENDIEFLPTPGASFQDTSFHFKVFAAAKRVALTQKAYLHYRIDNVNSSVKSQKKVFCICDEYKEIWSFAEKRDLTKTSLVKKIPRIQFGGYKWNLDRLSPSLQHAFFEVFTEEFQRFSDRGILDRDFFDEGAWNDLSELLDNPSIYYRNHYGPAEIDMSHIILVDAASENAVEALLSSLSSVGDSDEVFIIHSNASAELDKAVRDKRGDDKRIIPSEEILEGSSFGLVSLERIRGANIRVVLANKANIGTTDSFIYSKEELESLETPLFLSLLSCGFYCSKHSEDNRIADSAWTADLICPCTAKEYQAGIEAFGKLAEWINKKTACWPFDAKSEMLDAVAPLWKAIRRAYSSLSYAETLKAGDAPSAKCLDAAILEGGQEQNPEISVIIPVYNMAAYIEECLDTVLSQTLKSIEVICVDDGSTDDSLSILKQHSLEDKRVTIAHQINGGAGSARNRGMEIARGRYLAFIDPDDYYPEDTTLNTLLQAADRSGKPLCGGSFSTVDPDGNILDEFPEPVPFHTIKHEGYYSAEYAQNDYCWIRFLYKRSFMEEHRILFPELKWYEDPVFFTRALEAAGGYHGIPDVVYRYRVDYKTVTWTCEKVRDLLKGISENLDYAYRHRFNRLYTLLLHRLDYDYFKMISDHLYDEEVFSRLMMIQSKLDFSLVNFVKEEKRGFHLLHAFVELKNVPEPVEDPAIVRMAKRTAESAPYRTLRSIRERIGH